jgi:hypothetical protein
MDRPSIGPTETEALGSSMMGAGTPLPSWKDGRTRQTILEFVARVTRVGSREFVRPSERVAVFDHDGTLWCEYPLPAQIYFALDRLGHLVRKDSTLREREPYKAFLQHDAEAIGRLGKKAAYEVGMATHAGVTEGEFAELVQGWLSRGRHPVLGRPFPECAYRPQLELLDYLREHGFKTYVVSGGGVDLIRGFSEWTYGIPPEQVIGSSLATRLQFTENRVDLLKLAKVFTFDDRDVKPQNIALHIGRRPILAFGNSDGDLAMLRYTKASPGLRLALLLHHDDGEREFAYDRDFRISPLDEGLERADQCGFTLVSMKRDWNTIFAGTGVAPPTQPT